VERVPSRESADLVLFLILAFCKSETVVGRVQVVGEEAGPSHLPPNSFSVGQGVYQVLIQHLSM
jgi:hypothetical protein